VKFLKPQLMTWSGNKITDHNRSELQMSVERIENRARMADGTSRSYVIADKRTFSLSWTTVPGTAAHTVDNFWGAREMENFYNTANVFTLVVLEGDGKIRNYTVYMNNFSSTLVKRAGKYDWWDVSVEMVEV